LTQTFDTLNNSKHFYRERLNRDFSSKVCIYNKKQALMGTNFNLNAINDQLSIIIMSFDSLRATNKEDRKVYEENSNLMPFVGMYEQKDENNKVADESSLMQVLHQLKPVVIIDESHNAQSDLSKEMIRNLNPSFVLELTATPKKDSNIISIITANQLKQENMVKLPVIAYNRPSVERVIMEALDLRNSLEKCAKAERVNLGIPYIRPIVLFQAQPKNDDDDAVTFDKLKNNLIDIGISKEEIAIKTANINELKDVDLMSEECQIRYIITINALKEGWDCSFAYILASLANKTSKIDVEQILGRILRQPYQLKYTNKLLNMSYVLTSSNDFSSTLDNILLGLNNAGFSKNDCKVVRTNTLDNLNENKNNEPDNMIQQTLFDNHSEGENVDLDIFKVDVVKEELNKRNDATNENDNFISTNDNVVKLVENAENQSDEFDKQMEESQKDGTSEIPQELFNYSNIYRIKDEHKNEIEALKLPIFTFYPKGTLFDDQLCKVDALYLNDGFNLDNIAIPSNLTSSNDNIYKVDVETNSEGNVIKKSILAREDSDEFKNYLSLIPEKSRIGACKKQIVLELNNKFNNLDHLSINKYADRIIDSLKTEDEIISLQNNIYSIISRIKEFISKSLEEYRYNNFKNKLYRNEIMLNKEYQLSLSIILQEHTNSYLRTLYEEEDNKVNSLEKKFIEKISSLNNIKWWHRIIDRNDFSLNGFINHYPDFLIETNNGVIILVETKGEHLDGDDSKKKLELGNLWSNYSGPTNYKYYMAFEHSPLKEDGADLLDNIIEIISKL